jgi:cell division protease FtsH
MSGLGRINYQDESGPGFLGMGFPEGPREYSEQTAREIDLEIRKIVESATNEVREILTARRAALETIAQRLIDQEVIDGDELRAILLAHGAPPSEVAHVVPGDGKPHGNGAVGGPPAS